MSETAKHTPAHTLDALERAIAEAKPEDRTGVSFLKIDTRVLGWLIADSRRASLPTPSEQ